jgi:hypothetical protein
MPRAKRGKSLFVAFDSLGSMRHGAPRGLPAGVIKFSEYRLYRSARLTRARRVRAS